MGLITSQTAAAIGPTDFPFMDWQAAGMRLPSAYRSFLATLPAANVLSHIGRLYDRDWQGVRASLARAMALP